LGVKPKQAEEVVITTYNNNPRIWKAILKNNKLDSFHRDLTSHKILSLENKIRDLHHSIISNNNKMVLQHNDLIEETASMKKNLSETHQDTMNQNLSIRDLMNKVKLVSDKKLKILKKDIDEKFLLLKSELSNTNKKLQNQNIFDNLTDKKIQSISDTLFEIQKGITKYWKEIQELRGIISQNNDNELLAYLLMEKVRKYERISFICSEDGKLNKECSENLQRLSHDYSEFNRRISSKARKFFDKLKINNNRHEDSE